MQSITWNNQRHGVISRLNARFTRLARRHQRDEQGVAAIEFALLFPFMVILLLGSIEMFLMSMASRKMTRVTNTVADLITQAKGTLQKSDIRGYFQAAQHIMGKFPAEKLALSVFAYTIDPRTNQPTLSWKHNLGSFTCKGGRPTLTANQRAAMQDGNDLVITYGCYKYEVKIGRIALGDMTKTIKDEVVLRPRQRPNVVCTDCSS